MYCWMDRRKKDGWLVGSGGGGRCKKIKRWIEKHGWLNGYESQMDGWMIRKNMVR